MLDRLPRDEHQASSYASKQAVFYRYRFATRADRPISTSINSEKSAAAAAIRASRARSLAALKISGSSGDVKHRLW